MEYRRTPYRRRGKLRRTRGDKGDSASLGGVIIILLLIAAAVYLISASAAGTWLAKEVFAPLFASFGVKYRLPIVRLIRAIQYLLWRIGSRTDITVRLPAISCYALQMGVFSTQENASEIANTIKAQGAGGYVYNEGGMFRVLAMGYADETSAKSVRDRLRSTGNDCALHIIEADKRTFIVTTDSSSEQEAAVRAAFSAMYNAQKQLIDFALRLQENMTPTAAIDKVRDMKEGLPRLFYSHRTDAANDTLNKIITCYNVFIDTLRLEQADGQTNTAYCSLIKYSQLKLAVEYSNIKTLSTGAWRGFTPAFLWKKSSKSKIGLGFLLRKESDS